MITPGDVVSSAGLILGLITLAFRTMDASSAYKMAMKTASEEGDEIDAVEYIRTYGNFPLPVIVVTERKDLSRVLKAFRKYGVSESQYNILLENLRDGLAQVLRGRNAFVLPVRGELGRFLVIGTPRKVSRITLLHELGHIRSSINRDTLSSIDLSIPKASLLRSISFLSSTYAKYGKYGMVREEERAWDLAGVPPDDPSRVAALQTYRSGIALRSTLIKIGAMLGFYPLIRSLVNSVVGYGPVQEDIKTHGLIRAGLPDTLPGQMVEFQGPVEPVYPGSVSPQFQGVPPQGDAVLLPIKKYSRKLSSLDKGEMKRYGKGRIHRHTPDELPHYDEYDPTLGLEYAIRHAMVDWIYKSKILSRELERRVVQADSNISRLRLKMRKLQPGSREWVLLHREIEAEEAKKRAALDRLDALWRIPSPAGGAEHVVVSRPPDSLPRV